MELQRKIKDYVDINVTHKLGVGGEALVIKRLYNGRWRALKIIPFDKENEATKIMVRAGHKRVRQSLSNSERAPTAIQRREHDLEIVQKNMEFADILQGQSEYKCSSVVHVNVIQSTVTLDVVNGDLAIVAGTLIVTANNMFHKIGRCT